MARTKKGSVQPQRNWKTHFFQVPKGFFFFLSEHSVPEYEEVFGL